MKTPHAATFKGKKVRVQLKSGEVFVARFLNRTPGKRVEFEGRTVKQGDIKSFSHYREQREVSAWKK